jgi:hypothetical protein
MSRPRFLADNDFKDAIIRGVRRRESAVEFVPLRDLGFQSRSDADILEFAAENGWIVVSHDVNTMTAEAFARVAAGQTMNGLLVAHQRNPIGPVIDDLLLIWQASEAEEWLGQVRYLPL